PATRCPLTTTTSSPIGAPSGTSRCACSARTSRRARSDTWSSCRRVEITHARILTKHTMKRATLVAGLLVFIVSQLTLAQNQLFVGTWKADVAKSRYQPGPGPVSETLRFEPVGEKFKVSLDGVNQQGPYHSEATGKFDGVDVPVTAAPARQAAFTYAFRRIDDRTWDIVIKVNGQQRLLVHNVVSDDGKTMRGVSTVTDRGVV